MNSSLWYSFSLESGTILSGEASLKNVHRADDVSLIFTATLKTLKFLVVAILPLSVATTRTALAGLIRTYAAEGHTVFFAAHLDNIQQLPIIPVTQRLTKCFMSFLFANSSRPYKWSNREWTPMSLHRPIRCILLLLLLTNLTRF